MSHDYMSWTEDREPGDTRIEDYEADLLDEADLMYSVAKDEAAADALRGVNPWLTD